MEVLEGHEQRSDRRWRLEASDEDLGTAGEQTHEEKRLKDRLFVLRQKIVSHRMPGQEGGPRTAMLDLQIGATRRHGNALQRLGIELRRGH